MKKLIISALLITALSTPTLTHPLALKTVFDAGMLLTNLVITPTILNAWGVRMPAWTLIDKQRRKPVSMHPIAYLTTITQIGLYIYTIPALWEAYKKRNNSGTIKVKK